MPRRYYNKVKCNGPKCGKVKNMTYPLILEEGEVEVFIADTLFLLHEVDNKFYCATCMHNLMFPPKAKAKK